MLPKPDHKFPLVTSRGVQPMLLAKDFQVTLVLFVIPVVGSITWTDPRTNLRKKHMFQFCHCQAVKVGAYVLRRT